MSLKLNSLIASGYLPREVVPPFHTKELAEYSNEIENKLSDFSTTKSLCVSYTIPRLKGSRRFLKVPNPLHQFILSKTITDNWEELTNYFSSSQISLTTPVINEESDRAISPQYPYSEVNIQRVLRSYSSRYLVKVDLSRYYHTIYTHSIPWAYHGKEFAKKKRQLKYLGNLIDRDVRNTQDQQTFGIPVGPDTSLVISEIIGTKIDALLQEKYKNIEGLRYIDDIYLYFSDLIKAQECYAYINRIIRDYELEVNTLKTGIIELPEQIELEWVSELRLHHFKEKSKQDIINYFSKAFAYSKKYRNEYVLKYTLSRIKRVQIGEENWNLYESFILKSMIADPSVLPIALEIFLAYKEIGYTINELKIEKTVNEIILYHSNYNHNFEVAWALWIAITFNLKIFPKTCSKLAKIDNSFIALLTLNLSSKGLVKNLQTDLWKSFMQSKELYGRNWLLAYEAYMKNWLPSKSGKDYISNDEFFGYLKSKDISFYNPDNQIEFSKPFKEFKKYKFEQITDYENDIDNEDKIQYYKIASATVGY